MSPGSGDSADPAPILGLSQYYQPRFPQKERSRLKPSFPSMRWVFLVVLLFVFLAWDIAENYGHYTHMISSEIDDLGRRLGLW